MATNNVANKQTEQHHAGRRRSAILRRVFHIKHLRGSVIGLGIAFALLTPLMPLLLPGGAARVHAAPTSWTWINGQTIRDNENINWIDSTPNDQTHVYYKQGATIACPNNPVIRYANISSSRDLLDFKGWNENGNNTRANYRWIDPPVGTTDPNCTDHMKADVSIGGPNSAATSTFAWINKTIIRHFAMGVGTGDLRLINDTIAGADFTFQTDGIFKGLYTSKSEGNCFNTIEVNAASPGTGTFKWIQPDDDGKCQVSQTTTITISYTESYTGDPATAPGGGSGAGGAGAPPKSCETENKSGFFGWFLCGAIHELDKVIGWLDAQLQDALIIDTASTVETAQFKQVWGVMRNIALSLLLPFGMVVVIATALGIEILTPYQLHKVAPRFFVAIFWMVASLPILTFALKATNAATTGAIGITSSAFGGPGGPVTLASVLGVGDVAALFGSAAAGAGVALGALATGALSASILGSLALTVGLSMGQAYIFLEAREVALLILCAISPLPILSWLSPGNEKPMTAFRVTTGTLLALGPAVGVTQGVTRGAASLLPQDKWWLKILLFALSLLLIVPIAKRFSAGMEAVTGGKMISNAKQALAKNRANQRQENWQDFKMGNRGPQFVKKAGLNTGAFLESKKKGRFLGSSRFRNEAIAQQVKMNEMRHGQTERAKATQEDDGFTQQAATYKSAEEARANMMRDWAAQGITHDAMERSIAAVQASGGFSETRQNYAARRLAATGTGYKDIEQVQRTIARVAGSSESKAADLLGEINAVTKGVGRHDLAAGFTEQMRMYRAVQGRGGYEAVATGARTDVLEAAEYHAANTQAAKDVDAVTLMRDKNGAVENMARSLAVSFNAAQASGDVEEANHLAGLIAKIEQSGTYASTNNVVTAARQVVEPTSGVDPATGKPYTAVGPGVAVGTTGLVVPTAVATQGRAALATQASQSMQQVNPVTGNVEVVNQLDNFGNAEVDPLTNAPLPAVNPGFNAAAAAAAKRNAPKNPTNPNSINF